MRSTTLRVALALTIGVVAATSAPPAVAFTCGSWGSVARDDPGYGFDLLWAVDARTASDAWAAGWYLRSGRSSGLIERWNGEGWSQTLTPDPDPTSEYLLGVASVSRNDAWAVGETLGDNLDYGTLIERWNGDSWSLVTPPALPGADGGLLNGVAVVAGTDEAWAIVYHSQPQMARDTLIEHFDGASWTIVPSPNPGGFSNELLAVSAVATDDVWAVGYQIDFSFVARTLTMHWNGLRWRVMPSQDIGTKENVLSSVSALPDGTVWAVGHRGRRTLAEHWVDGAWTIEHTPDPGTRYNTLSGVHATGPDDVWAVGWDRSSGDPATLTLHRGPAGWAVVPSPENGRFLDQFNAVDATSSTDVWAVGEFQTNRQHGSAIAHYC